MTLADYNAGLGYLRERDANHALIPLIERKYSVVNCAYLTKALNSLPKIKEKKKEHLTGDVTFDNLQAKLRKLYIQRGKLTNRFHELVTRIDRVHNSKQIHEVQTVIERLWLTIAHYEEHGTMPLDQNPYNLPSDPIELRKKKDSFVQSRSRIRKEIKILSLDAEKNMEKIAKKQVTLDEYDKKIADARKKIAAGI